MTLSDGNALYGHRSVAIPRLVAGPAITEAAELQFLSWKVPNDSVRLQTRHERQYDCNNELNY